MTAYSSTSIHVFDRHCPAALGFHERGAVRDREVFSIGLAAHAMCQALVIEGNRRGNILAEGDRDAVMRMTGRVLTSQGREFRGVPEPPLSPTAVAAGRDIVATYLSYCPWDEGALPLPGALPERTLAIDEEGRPVESDSGAARWLAAIDAIELVDDWTDETGMVMPATVIWEYKTAWPTNADELDTMQTRGQAVLAHTAWPDRVLVRRVVNLRTGRHFEHFLDPDVDAASLERWRTDIMDACDAADRTRVARPGAGCLDCPWILQCPDALSIADSTEADDAQRFAVVSGVADALRVRLKAAAAGAPIPIDGGEVGYRGFERATLVDRAHIALAAAWHGAAPSEEWCADNASWISLLEAVKIGVTGVRSLARRLFPGRNGGAGRKALEADLIDTSTRSARFGVWRGPRGG